MTVLTQTPGTIQVYRSLDGAVCSEWDRLCQPDDYFHSRYLRALAHAKLDASFRYFLVREADRVVGITFGYFTRYPLAGPCKPLVFISGSPLNFGFPFALRTRGKEIDVFVRLLQAMRAEAQKQHAASLLVRDLWMPGPQETYGPALQSLGFVPMPLFQRALMHLPWQTFEGYLMALQSSYRRKTRAELQKIAANQYHAQTVTGPDIEPYLADIARLWKYTYLKYKDRDQLFLSDDYFRSVAALPESIAFLLFHRERLAAFGLSFARDSLLETNHSGVDYTVVGNIAAHRFIEYETIRYAINQHFKTIDFGISNEAGKLRLGCCLQGVSGYICPLTPLSSVFTRLHLERWLLPEYGFKVASPLSPGGIDGAVASTVFKGE